MPAISKIESGIQVLRFIMIIRCKLIRLRDRKLKLYELYILQIVIKILAV